MTEDVAPPAKQGSQALVLGVLLLVGALALAAILMISGRYLGETTASDGQDMSSCRIGVFDSGAGATPSQKCRGQVPVANIAAALVANAFSFSSADFDQQVANAKKLMTSGMQQRYGDQIKAQKTQAAIGLGLQVSTSLVHLDNDPKKVAFIGVVSLTKTSGEFLMYMQRQTTTKGSTNAQATAFVLDVKVVKVGDTWLLDDVETRF